MLATDALLNRLRPLPWLSSNIPIISVTVIVICTYYMQVCTCPSRALIQESIYEKFMERAVKRVAAIKLGTPLDTATQLGAQNSKTQFDKIVSRAASNLLVLLCGRCFIGATAG